MNVSRLDPTSRSRSARSFLPALALVSLALGACAPAGPPAGAPAPADAPLRLQVLHTNDFHGRFLPEVVGGDTVGGSAVLAAWFDSARVRFDGPTIVLSGGDIMQGTAISNLSWGRGAIDLHNRKGLDASVLGNHEFDWGIDTLRARVAESAFPWLAANIYTADADVPPDWIQPWTILERDGVRVGVVGVALAETPAIVMAGRTGDLRFGAEAPAIDRGVRALRDEGVDFVVVTTHVGAVCDQAGDPDGTVPTAPSTGCRGHLVEVLEAVTERPDLVVAGHTHLRNLFDVNGIPVIQAPAYARGVTVSRLERRPGEPARVVYRAIPVPRAAEVDPDTAVAAAVARWGAEVGPVLDEAVAALADSMSNAERQPLENPAGNLLADAQRWATNADVGLVNNGSLRRSLPAGEATFGVLYEFQPFQNELVRVHMTGARLLEVLEFGLTDGGRPWTHVSGIQVEVDPARPRGERVRRVVRLLPDGTLGAPIAPDERVSVGTTDFLALGGDGYVLLAEGDVERTGPIDVDGLIAYLRSLPQPVEPPPTGRWQGVPR
jgi:2',3'-cyclic-nucleotide 2'-phosphodiesterase (5'-nucleotidase family)